MVKKVLSALCTIVLAANLIVVPIASAAIGDKAIVDFSGGSPKLTNVSKIMISEEQGADYVTRAGRKALRMLPAKKGEFVRLDLDDNVFPKEPKGKATTVTVDYFDEGSGYFTLRYDSVTNNVMGIMEDHADLVYMTDSKTWKSYTFYMDDAAYGGTWQDTDINIALYSLVGEKKSTGDILIGRIEVEKCFPKDPVSKNLVSASYGNILGGNDEMIAWNLENVTDLELDMKLEWIVYDEFGNKRQRETFEKVFAPNESISHEWTPAVTEFGIYKITEKSTVSYLENGEKKEVVSTGVHDFSIVNKFVEGEPKNDKMIVCSHIATQGYDKNAISTAASEAGFGRIRDELRWSGVETKRGIIDLSGKFEFPYTIEEKEMKLHFLAAFANPNYESCLDEKGNYSEGRIPSTKEDLDAFVNYVLTVLDKYHDQIDSIEIWNEPNNAGFNGGLDGATQMSTYTNLAKACYPAIKAKYPEMKVTIFGMAGADIPKVTEAMELGIYDYCDSVSVHPYQWNGKFSQNQYINELTELRNVMAKYGNGNVKEVWLTEMGFTSGNNCRAGVGAVEQAIYTIQSYVIGVGDGLIDRYYYYNLTNTGLDIGSQEQNFGLVSTYVTRKTEIEDIEEAPDFTAPNTARSAKRSYVAVAELNKLLGQAEIEKKPELGEGFKAYQFLKKDGKRVNVIWSDKTNSENITFKINGNAEILDMYGNVIGETNSEKNTFTLTMDKRPIYIEGNYSEIAVTDSEVVCQNTEMTIANGDSFDIDFTDIKGRNLKVETETTDSFVITDKSENLVNGSGRISLVTAEDAKVGKEKVKVKFYDSDVLVGDTDVYVEIINPVKLNISENRNTNSLDRYFANVTITNMSEISTYNGDCRITEPEEVTKSSGTAHFTSLKPGESITIPLSMPRAVAKKYYDVKIETNLNNGKSVSIDKSIRLESQKSRLMNGNLVLMEKVKNQPAIDGVLSDGEWTQPPVEVSTADKYFKIYDDWKGPEDLSFKAWTAWDEDYFYLAVEAEDDAFSQEYTSDGLWQGDSVQFGIRDGEPDHLASQKYNEYGMALLKDGPALYRFSVFDDYLGVGDVEDVEIAIKREGTKTCYELKIPWTEVVGPNFKPIAGSSVAFSVIMNDNDGKDRKGYIMYTDGIGTAKNAELFKCFDFAE